MGQQSPIRLCQRSIFSWAAIISGGAMQATTPPQQSRTTLCWTVHAKEPVFALVAGPNGLVGLGCKDCVLLLTQAQSKPHGVTMERLPGGCGPFTTICFMGSTMVATGSSGMLYAWDTQTKAQRASKRLFPGKASGDRIKDWVLLSGLTDTRLAAACCDLRCGSRCCAQPARSILSWSAYCPLRG